MISDHDLEYKAPDKEGDIEIILPMDGGSEEYVWLTRNDLENMLKLFDPPTKLKCITSEDLEIQLQLCKDIRAKMEEQFRKLGVEIDEI